MYPRRFYPAEMFAPFSFPVGADAEVAVIGNVVGAAANLHGAHGRAAPLGSASGSAASLHGASGRAEPAPV